MYKATASDVRDLQRWGAEDEVISSIMGKSNIQPSIRTTGYYSPPSANWSWQIGLVEINGHLYELLTRFGVVEGGREVWLRNYKLTKTHGLVSK